MTEIKRPLPQAQPRRVGAPSVQANKGAQVSAARTETPVDGDERQSERRAPQRGPVLASQPLAGAFAAPARQGAGQSVGLGRTNAPIAHHSDLSDLKNISDLVQSVKQEPRTRGVFGMMSRSKTPNSPEREALKAYQSKLSSLPQEQRERQLVRASLADIKDALK